MARTVSSYLQGMPEHWHGPWNACAQIPIFEVGWVDVAARRPRRHTVSTTERTLWLRSTAPSRQRRGGHPRAHGDGDEVPAVAGRFGGPPAFLGDRAPIGG